MTSFGGEVESGMPNTMRQAEDEENSVLRRLHSERVDLDLQLTQFLKRYRPAHPKVRKLQGDLASVEQKIGEEEIRAKKTREERTHEIIGSKQKEIKYSILTRKVDIN